MDTLMENTEPMQWFVMNAYKNEKRAEEALEAAKGMEYFIPKRYAVRKYQGKPKRVLVPVIPNLVFVKARYQDLEEFKRKCPYLRYATIRESGHNKIMKVASCIEEDIIYYHLDELDFKAGMRVRVVGGAFEGVEGTLIKLNGKRRKRVVVKLDGVLAISAAEIETDLIEVLKD